MILLLVFWSFLMTDNSSKASNKKTLNSEQAHSIVNQFFSSDRRFRITKRFYHLRKNRLTVEITANQDNDNYVVLMDEKTSRVIRIEINDTIAYKWKGVEVIAHRGAVEHAPENTLSSFEKAIELGADRIELDVRETADGHIVVLHDESVDRTTDGSGLVSEYTLDSLKKLDAGSWFDDKFSDQMIPTLREALQLIGDRAEIEIDYKFCNIENLLAILDEFGILYTTNIYVKKHSDLEVFRSLNEDLLLKTIPAVGKDRINRLLTQVKPKIVNVKWLV